MRYAHEVPEREERKKNPIRSLDIGSTRKKETFNKIMRIFYTWESRQKEGPIKWHQQDYSLYQINMSS